MTFLERVEKLCAEEGISTDKLCKDLNLSNATASKWRKGAEPRNATKKAVADYFNVTLEYITGESDKKEKPGTEVTPPELEDVLEKLNAILPNLSDEDKDKLIDYGNYLIQKQNQ